MSDGRFSRRRRLLLVTLVIVVALGVAWAAWGWLALGLDPREAPQLAYLLEVRAGQTIAEIGAGDGSLTVEMARRVGARGRVYSTELSVDRRDDIRAAVREAGLTNVVVVEAAEKETRLPEACCQSIFMRLVYHHIADRAAFNRSVRRALVPDGRLAVIDLEPRPWFGFFFGGSAAGRGHGISRDAIVAEITPAGFEVTHQISDWGDWYYCVVFRVMETGQPIAATGPPG
jgi:ubiquinone/menaquinone biosynthesis C-methylase UbiE